MDKKSKSSIAMFFSVLFITLLLGETILRIVGRFDEDRGFWVRSFRCYPYRMPLHEWSKKIDQYLLSKSSIIHYDPLLGWAPRPGSASENGKYEYNSDAIRTDHRDLVVSKVPAQGVLRIAIFGDSFVHGDDVPFEDTWGYFLERNLKKAGIDAEVLNFGVGGYGMDQSLLRWREIGYLYEPQIVIFGLQLDNIMRNGNLARPLYFPNTEIPFFKPRFLLEKNGLKLVNTPTPSPDKIMGIVENFNTWEYSEYEYWYDKDKYKNHIFLNSKLISFCYSFLNEKYFKKRSAREQDLESLSLAIISAFKAGVESKGKSFYVIFLPTTGNLKSSDIAFLRKVDQVAAVINPQSRFLAEADKLGVQALIPGHYSSIGNKIVADVLMESLSLPNEDQVRRYSNN